MPAIAKTTDDEIIDAARSIIEREGMEKLSLQAVAQAVGIRAPSLYKRFTDRGAIIRSVQHREFRELEVRIASAARDAAPADALREIAGLHWRFAHERPHLYILLFTASSVPDDSDVTVRTRALQPVLAACRQLVGETDSLAAARTLTAYVHGFVLMEIAGAFHLGGSVEEAFTFGLDTILHGLTAQTAQTAQTARMK